MVLCNSINASSVVGMLRDNEDTQTLHSVINFFKLCALTGNEDGNTFLLKVLKSFHRLVPNTHIVILLKDLIDLFKIISNKKNGILFPVFFISTEKK